MMSYVLLAKCEVFATSTGHQYMHFHITFTMNIKWSSSIFKKSRHKQTKSYPGSLELPTWETEATLIGGRKQVTETIRGLHHSTQDCVLYLKKADSRSKDYSVISAKHYRDIERCLQAKIPQKQWDCSSRWQCTQALTKKVNERSLPSHFDCAPVRVDVHSVESWYPQ